jgi:hypothetical protein
MVRETGTKREFDFCVVSNEARKAASSRKKKISASM